MPFEIHTALLLITSCSVEASVSHTKNSSYFQKCLQWNKSKHMKWSLLFPLKRKLIFRVAPEESNYKTMKTIKKPSYPITPCRFSFPWHIWCFINQLCNRLVPLDGWVHQFVFMVKGQLNWDCKEDVHTQQKTYFLQLSSENKFYINSTSGNSWEIRARNGSNRKIGFLPTHVYTFTSVCVKAVLQ